MVRESEFARIDSDRSIFSTANPGAFGRLGAD